MGKFVPAILVFIIQFGFFNPAYICASSLSDNPETMKPAQNMEKLSNLSPNQVDALLATLSDEQVRLVLAQKLKQDASKTKPSKNQTSATRKAGRHALLFYEMEDRAANAAERIYSSFSRMGNSSEKWIAAFSLVTSGKGTGYLGYLLCLSFLIILGGFFAERLFLRLTEDIRKNLLSAVPIRKLQRLGRFVSRILLDSMGVFVYFLVTFLLFILVFDKGDSGHGVVSKVIIISYYFNVIMLAGKIILSPTSSFLRLIPIADEDAVFLYNWLYRIVFVLALFAAPGLIFRDVGGSDILFMQTYSAAGLSLTFMLMVIIWQSRGRVARAIREKEDNQNDSISPLRLKLACNWQYLAILYVIAIGCYWTANVLINGEGEIIKLIASLFLIPIFIGLDQWVQRLLKIASGEWPEIIELSDEEPLDSDKFKSQNRMNIRHYIPFIKRAFRAVLIAFLFFSILKLWGIDLSVGRFFTRTAMSIIVTVLLGFIIWEFIKARIDRRLEEEMPDQDEDMEEGGAGGSRSGTLLLLLRKFVLVVMFVVVTLVILQSFGLNIGPLIAGAGVIGLAIGFGSQALVRDIISGIFFLIDDAFRVGDYIETAGTKGTVELISLRSLRLRHPRGMVHTIPFGDMGSVTNFSRDYIITKLDIRVRFDADVEKIRKIVKKINVDLQNHEELGAVLLDKIKSQGVRELDDSAMILRVKFKTIPGGQFGVRREIYHRLQQKFSENGIEFAHRNVTVYLPEEAPNHTTGPKAEKNESSTQTAKNKLAEAGAAAALAISQADAATKQTD